MSTRQPEARSRPYMETSDELRGTNRTTQPIITTASPPSSGAQRSFAERKARNFGPTPLRIVEGNDNMSDINRPPPGDVVTRKKRSQSKPELTRQRSSFFEDAFATKDVNPAKDRLLSEAIVMADIKTNVEVADERAFMTDISYLLSNRYQRPMSSIVVTLQHSASMVFCGTFQGAYVMSVHALPAQLQPTTNKRNAALIQKHLEDALGVKPSRGLLRFVPTPEENVARNGKTLAGEIEEGKLTAGEAAEQFTGLPRARSKPQSRLSVRSFGNFRSSSATMAPPQGHPSSSGGGGESVQRASTPFRAELPPAPVKTAKRTKSFVANLFGRK